MPETLSSGDVLLHILVLAIAYTIGCLNSSYYLIRLTCKTDIRDQHSHNAGATNTGRILGNYGFLAVLFIDLFRGYASVIVGEVILGTTYFSGVLLFFTVLGHIHPIQLNFRGGKGVACLAGGALVISTTLTLLLGAIFAVLYLLSRKKILSGVTVFILYPLGIFYSGLPALTTASTVATILLILFTYYRMSRLVSK